MLSRLALEQERILNPLLDRVRTADHNQLRSLTGLIRNLSRNARNKDEMCEFCPWSSTQPMSPKELALVSKSSGVGRCVCQPPGEAEVLGTKAAGNMTD